jgi:hypothetical protein
MFTDLDFDVGETDPVRKIILLALCMAHEDGATAVAFGPPHPDGSSTLLQFEDEGAWHEFPPLPAPMPSVAAELERMAGISQVTGEGILDRTVAGSRMRWRVAAKAPGAEYLLTPLPG